MPDLNEKILAFLRECADECEGLPDYIKGPTSKKAGKYPRVLYSGPVWDENEIAAHGLHQGAT